MTKALVVDLLECNIRLPDSFTLNAADIGGYDVAREWTRRVADIVKAMTSVDRSVLVHVSETGDLYLSTVETVCEARPD